MRLSVPMVGDSGLHAAQLVDRAYRDYHSAEIAVLQFASAAGPDRGCFRWPMTREARQKIARALKVNVSDVEAMEVRLGAADQSLNAPMHAGGEEEHRQDFLADVPANPEEAMIGMRDGAARSRRLAQAVSELTPRERGIVHQRRLTEQGATLEELGRELGVSKERMRQLEHRALVKLKTAIERQIKTTEDLLPPDLGELDRCIAAIDEQIAAGDKARSVTREKYRCPPRSHAAGRGGPAGALGRALPEPPRSCRTGAISAAFQPLPGRAC